MTHGGIDGIRNEELLDMVLKSPYHTFDTIKLYPSVHGKVAKLQLVICLFTKIKE